MYIFTHTHTHTHTKSVMGKLSSKLYINENNTNISFYQVYLQTFYENKLKYYRLDLIKEIFISFNDSLQITLESPASLSNSLFV